MRKVFYKKWIPQETEEFAPWPGTIETRTKKGTNCFEPYFASEGTFCTWGVSYEEFENGPGNYTVAIIETPNGEVIEVLPCHLKFVVKEEPFNINN